MATSASQPRGNEINFSKAPLPIIPGKVRGTPVQALFSSGSTGNYMTIECVERCKLSPIMDFRSPGYMVSAIHKEKIQLLGFVKVPIEFQVKLPNGQMKTVEYPTLFYVIRNDVVDIVLGCKFPVQQVTYSPNTLTIGEGEIPFLPRGEWNEPARSTPCIIATRFLQLHSSKGN